MQEPKVLPREEELLSLASRVSLKHSLFLKRGKLTSKGWRPICAICGQPIMEQPDMHEAILTKGNVQGSFLREELLNTEENCVLVHPGGKNLDSCHSKAHTKRGRELAIRHLLRYKNHDQIIQWLDKLVPHFKSGIVYERMAEVLDMTDIISKERSNTTASSRVPRP
jgi:hypothetical protein